MQFKKSPAYIGKILRLYAGGSDKLIGDNEILNGAYWKKFADQGLLVKIDSEPVKPVARKPLVKPKKTEEPVSAKKLAKALTEIKKEESKPEPESLVDDSGPEIVDEPKSEGTMTKSSADKMAKAQGDSGKSVSTKKKKSSRNRKS